MKTKTITKKHNVPPKWPKLKRPEIPVVRTDMQLPGVFDWFLYYLFFIAVHGWAICISWNMSFRSLEKTNTIPNPMSKSTNTVLGNSFIHTDHSLTQRLSKQNLSKILYFLCGNALVSSPL